MAWGGLQDAADDLAARGWAVVDSPEEALELERIHGRGVFPVPTLQEGVLEERTAVVVVDPWRLSEELAGWTSLADSPLFPSLQSRS